jgi:oligopeptide transport system ATP-binding protein
VLITHDMGVIAGLCDRVMVMYAGRVVEAAPVNQLFHNPQHPYTAGLLRSMPRLDEVMQERLTTVPGQPPNMQRLPSGCAFRTRCTYRMDICATELPPLRPIAPERSKACHLQSL